MTAALRFLPVGPGTLMVELPGLEETLALFDALHADPVAEVAEIVPGARTLLVRMRPGIAADAAVAQAIALRAPATGAVRGAGAAALIELPMRYDGADLADVAAHLDLTTAEVIAAHQAATWQVAFCGFAPGFAYMTGDDPRFDLPRRQSPRPRIPAGSVALAAGFCGVYPKESPGGWQLIGTTRVPMWDLARDPPALLRPGARVRFVEGAAKAHPVVLPPERRPGPGLTVLSSAFPILLQDEGRPGMASMGVSASGALDIGALRRANRAVGNPSGAPALEITLGPVRLRADMALTLALSGAAKGAELVPPDGSRLPVESGRAFAMDAGDLLVIPAPAQGMRSYLALRGGYDAAPVLGSASTDTLAFIGPEPLAAGGRIAAAARPAGATIWQEDQPPLPRAGDLVTLPVTLGPRTDWFTPEAVSRFLRQEWRVTPQSSRVGIRLEGAVPLGRSGAGELPSEGTEVGAIQVPHSGQPVLFLADHPLTGGYPVIATLLPAALDLAGQLPPGARIRFAAERAFAPMEIRP